MWFQLRDYLRYESWFNIGGEYFDCIGWSIQTFFRL
jgi:hypothetical protein